MVKFLKKNKEKFIRILRHVLRSETTGSVYGELRELFHNELKNQIPIKFQAKFHKLLQKGLPDDLLKKFP